MKTINPLNPIFLILILLLWSGPFMAQETEDASTTNTDGVTDVSSDESSAYNWVNRPEQNPLPPPSVTNFGLAPQMLDIDGDGDLDAFDGRLYFENIGTPNQPKFKTPATEITHQFFGGKESTNDSYYVADFRFADMDNDGDLDAFVRPPTNVSPNTIKYYENTGNPNTPKFEERTGTANPLAEVQLGEDYDAILTFVDIDADQDLDIFFGEQSNHPVQYYENTGNSRQPVFEQQTDSANPLNETDIPGSNDMPNFADMDRDGDLDVFMTSRTHLVYYENTGNANQPQFEKRSANPLNEIAQRKHIYPIDLVDLDNDNDWDVLMGREGVPFTYYQNTGPLDSLRFVEDATFFEEPETVDVGHFSYPSFVDIDNDGDKDAFIGNQNGTIFYYENIGNARVPQFVKRTDTANPLDETTITSLSNPSFVDIDGDGDRDAFITSGFGNIFYYKNTGSASRPQFVETPENPLGEVVIEGWSGCSWVDIDHDGDMDVFITTTGQPLRFFENLGSVSSPVFEEYTGQANPLNAIQPTFTSSLSFNDMDDDGDSDAVFTDMNLINYYENTGGSRFPVFEKRTNNNNPFFKLKLTDSWLSITPSFVDIDNDGQLEVFIGPTDGTVRYYKNVSLSNNNTPFKASFDNHLVPFTGAASQISFADLDNDNDWDAFISQFSGQISYIENIGDSNNPRFMGEPLDNHPLALHIKTTKASNVILVDLDQDKDLDAILVNEFNNYLYYENIGNANHPRFEKSVTNPFKGITTDSLHLVDIDNDGDLDCFIKKADGIGYFENTSNAHLPIFEERVETANPLGKVNVPSPAFSVVDIDQDGDLDAFIGYKVLFSDEGSIKYFENIGDSNQPQFEERTETANPLASVKMVSWAMMFVDLENDGDLDIFIGQDEGTLSYYENTGSATTPIFVERVDHFLDWVDVGIKSTPHFADFDNDGDWDIFVGELFGNLKYYENTGNATHPVFQKPSSTNPLNEVNTDTYPHTHFVDIDGDNDQDVFVGDLSHAIRYYENIGDVNHPKFVERAETFTTLVGDIPTFIDIDNDQDWDAFIMSFESVRYYENVGQVDAPLFEERVEMANPLNLVGGGHDLEFVDFDSDQDWDVVVVKGFVGKWMIEYYENIGQPGNPKFIENQMANPINIIPPRSIGDFSFIDLDNDGDMEAFYTSMFVDNTYYVNTSTKVRFLADNYALPKGGKYNQSREVNLGCLDCTQIYYTLDGSQPSTASPVFTAPFQVTETTTLKFFRMDAQGNASEVTTETYLIDTLPPVLTLTRPVNNQVLLEIGRLEGTAQDLEGGSGVDRIELQIHNGPLYLSGDNDDPFSKSPIWIKFPQLTSSEQWFYDFERLQLPIGPYTITAHAFDQAGNFAEETLTVMKVEQAISDLFLELSSATLLNDATLNAKGSLVSRRFPPVPENLAGLPIELTITAPDGSTRTETTQLLSDIGQYEFNELSDFTLEGAYTLQTRFAGNELLTEAISGQKTVLVGESAGYAIIIQGRIENGEGLESHNKTTNRIYQVLKERGFEDANIFYFNPNPEQEGIEIDGPPTVADFVTIEEMQHRINGSPAPFYLIMIDHGDKYGNFYIDDTDLEAVTPDIWAWWLDELEAGLKELSKPRIIMLGYCFSGKTLAAISKPGRIVISSAAAEEESYKGPREPDGIRGGEYFMDELFNALGRGGSFRDAFNKAAEKTNEYTDRGGNQFINIVNDFGDESVQHPLIDIDGDGKGSHDAKLELNTETNPSVPNSPYNLADMYLGAGADYDTNYAGNPADILSVADTIYLSPEQTAADLSMTVNEALRVKDAAVNVRLPSTELKPADTEHTGYAEQREITELVEINLLCDPGLQRCQRNTDDIKPDLFKEPGKYELYYFVVDNETHNRSPIHRSVVYKTKADNTAPAAFNLFSPFDGATTKTAFKINWETAADPDRDALTYTLLIAEDRQFERVIYQQPGLRHSELELEATTLLKDLTQGLKDNRTYYWKVEAVDYFGAITASRQVFSFQTNTTAFTEDDNDGILGTPKLPNPLIINRLTGERDLITLTTTDNQQFRLENHEPTHQTDKTQEATFNPETGRVSIPGYGVLELVAGSQPTQLKRIE